MKSIIILLTLTVFLNANINISQNIKALYKGVELTEIQKNYILDNQDKNIEIITKALSQKIRNYKNLDEKNIISFLKK